MEQKGKPLFDPAGIKGPYPLLAAVLVVIESIMVFWLARADSGIERGVAGLMALLIMFGIFYVILRLVSLTGVDPSQTNRVDMPGVGQVQLPAADAAASEPARQESSGGDPLIGPDKSYIIGRRPPADEWTITETTLVDWAAKKNRLSVDSYTEVMQAGATPEQVRQTTVLVFTTKDTHSLIPIPGQTRIDGRPFPTGLEIQLQTQVVIVPFERLQPPFYFAKGFTHNFVSFLTGIMGSNVMTLTSLKEVSPPNARRRIVVEMSQMLDNVLLDDKPATRVGNHMTLIGFEGDVRDHVLLAEYIAIEGEEDATLKRQHQAIQDLISSFQPITDIDPEAFRRREEEHGEAEAEKFAREFAITALGREMTFILYQLNDADLDMEKADDRNRALRALRPMRQLAKAMEIHHEGFEKLWSAIDQAEAGDAAAFKEQVPLWIKLALENEDDKPAEETPAVAAPEPTSSTSEPARP